MSTAKFKVGDTVFIPASRLYGGSDRVRTVVKVGRSWATLEGGQRFDVNKMAVERGRGYGLGARVYRSRDEYIEAQNIEAAWDKIRQQFQYRTPAHLTLGDTREIARILRVDLTGVI